MTTRFCKDCKWANDPGAGGLMQCNSPRGLSEAHPVTGERKPVDSWCSTQRMDPWPVDWLTGTCGRRGRWWEARE